MFSFLKKKQHTDKRGKKSALTFITQHYSGFLLSLTVLFILAGFYLIFVLTYNSLIVPESINPQDISTEQKKLNITQYEHTYSSLQEKQEEASNHTVPQLFTQP